VPLAAKAFDVLVVLVRNHGRLLSKEALLQEVWPGVIVEEVNLTVNISAIRKALGGDETDDWIETVPRHGYRFRADVNQGVAALPEKHARMLIRAWPARMAILAAVAGLAMVVLWRTALHRPSAEFASVAVLPFAADSGANEDVADGWMCLPCICTPRRRSRARLSSHNGRGGLKQIVEMVCPPRY